MDPEAGHGLALLDWEFAWYADPIWDLLRVDIWRFREIGATPRAFWDAYGYAPDLRWLQYRFHIMLRMEAQSQRDKDPTMKPT